jgi:predicted nucleic acid-binding protein
MAHERVVIDTSVLISGLFSTTSKPAQALERAVTRDQL